MNCKHTIISILYFNNTTIIKQQVIKLIKDVKIDVFAEEQTISKSTKCCLDRFANQQVQYMSLSFDEFIQSSSDTRVSNIYTF